MDKNLHKRGDRSDCGQPLLFNLRKWRKKVYILSRSLYAALLLLSLIWGGSFMFIKVLLLHQVGRGLLYFSGPALGLFLLSC